MARTFDELIILKRSALRYILARESKLLSLGKKPINKKVANFVRTHNGRESDWGDLWDSLNEDLTRNINVFDWRCGEKSRQNIRRSYRLNSASRDLLLAFERRNWGGRMAESPVVKVEQGSLQGKIVNSPTGKAFYSFQGIPYAKPPLGSLRFKAPQPPESWDGVRDATSEGNISAQIEPIHKEYLGDENCLFLNVYTPNLDGEFLPVMIYIHGGGFKFYSGNSSMYGADYLVEKDVVVVTINYRCGALGFLCLNTPEVPGNAGLKDMVQAIRWVKDNIKNFGGNSRNITLFGNSAGGASTSIFTASPLTKNLINRAIIQSGTALNSWAFQKHPLDSAKSLARSLGSDAEDADEILEFLAATPVKDIVEATEKLHPPSLFYEKGSLLFGPVVEKEFPDVEPVITEAFIDLLTSGRVADFPIMIGSTALEFSSDTVHEDLQIFIPDDFHIERNSEESVDIANKLKRLYFNGQSPCVNTLNQYFELLSDKLINVDTMRYVQYLVKSITKPIYLYKFDYVGELNINKKLLTSLGISHAAHMDELGYLFKNDLPSDEEPTAQDINMRETMLRLWTNFAKSGNPTPEENHYLTVTWLPVTKDNLYCLKLSNELSLETDAVSEKMKFWNELYNKHFKIWEHPKTNTEQSPRKVEKVIQENSLDENNEITNIESKPSTVKELVNVVEEVQIKEPPVELSPEPEIKPTAEQVELTREPENPTPEPVQSRPEPVQLTPEPENRTPEPDKVEQIQNGVAQLNGNGVDNAVKKLRTSNEIKMVSQSNGGPKDVIRANDPPEDDLPKNIGVNKFVNFFESLGGKK